MIIPHYEHTHIGFNYRLSKCFCSHRVRQIEILDKRVKKERNFNHYVGQLSNINEISFQEEKENFFTLTGGLLQYLFQINQK